MDHIELRDKIFEYHDGRLSGMESAQVEAHLKECADCLVFYENWKKVSKALFAPASSNGGSETFVRGVMDRLEALETRRQGSVIPIQWFAPALGMAAMLFLALIPSRQALSAEAIFMNGGLDSLGSADEMLSFVMEER